MLQANKICWMKWSCCFFLLLRLYAFDFEMTVNCEGIDPVIFYVFFFTFFSGLYILLCSCILYDMLLCCVHTQHKLFFSLSDARLCRVFTISSRRRRRRRHHDHHQNFVRVCMFWAGCIFRQNVCMHVYLLVRVQDEDYVRHGWLDVANLKKTKTRCMIFGRMKVHYIYALYTQKMLKESSLCAYKIN